MKNLKTRLFVVLMALLMPTFAISTTSCNSHKPKHKKLKRGRPIPCPVKDC